MRFDVKISEVFEPLLEPARYKGAHGGRGSGKSRFFGGLCVEQALSFPYENGGVGLRFAALREVQKSLKFSAKSLIEKILRENHLGEADGFKVFKDVIETPHDGIIIFQGLQDHTADSIQSLDGFHRAWLEEARNVTANSIKILVPTIREDGSELWFSWNPKFETDPVDVMLRGTKKPEDSIVVESNYYNNPFFPKVLSREVDEAFRRNKDDYYHIWCGSYLKRSTALIFKNWTVEDFNIPADAEFRQGIDWGFSNDPSVLIRCFISGRKLFVCGEAWGKGVPLDHLPTLFDTVPRWKDWPSVADSSRPETIDKLKRGGARKITASIKGKGSVDDGIEFLKSFDIIVHPSCKYTIKELGSYSWKTDENIIDENGDPMILPTPCDKDNHVIDALRYACESARRSERRIISGARQLGVRR